MTTSMMKKRYYNEGDKPGTKSYDNRVSSGIVVGDSYTQSAIDQRF